MTREERGKDELDGFVSLEALKARAKKMTKTEFVASCAGPALVVTGDEGSASSPGAAAGPGGSSFLIVTLEGASSQAAVAAKRYLGRVVFLAKRPGNPFPNMISLGRATSNDIVIPLETISKLHGYFLREGDAYFYTDYQSTNGSLVNGKKLDKGEKRLLSDGDRMKLGLDVNAVFLMPATLYARVHGGAA